MFTSMSRSVARRNHMYTLELSADIELKCQNYVCPGNTLNLHPNNIAYCRYTALIEEIRASTCVFYGRSKEALPKT